MSLTEDKSKPAAPAAEAVLNESDRGCMILGAALLDEALEELLRSVCRQTPEDTRATIDPLFQGYAPLATFSAKIQIAFALGLLPRGLRDKIEIIRRLRNDFAHEWGPIDFGDPRYATRIDLLIDRSTEKEFQETIDPLGFGPRKEQILWRAALIATIWSMIRTITILAQSAREGQDIRARVQDCEKDGLWTD